MFEGNNILKNESNNTSPIRLENISAVYFLGIGGIGMSAIARYFLSKGVKVSGYDKTSTLLTKQLEAEGMQIHYEDNVALVDEQASIVVYTPAVPKDHKELNYYKNNNAPLLKRSQVLGIISAATFNVCVAGTHGKTTTSAMIAHILRDSGYGCNAFLGGIASNYNTNFWADSGKSKQEVCVLEADEYDRSFLQLSPDVAIITSMDADHLDIYGTEKNMQDAFIEFAKRIKTGGLLICKNNLARITEMQADNKVLYAGNDIKANAYANNIRIHEGSYVFDLVANKHPLQNIVMNMGGMHNIENAVAAITVAIHLSIADEAIKAAVENFAGVKRRFQYIIKPAAGVEGPVYIDDYAHHPEELRALINSAKELFPGRKCSVVFQPHLFSRTKDFAKEFAAVLDLADETLLLPIYPARELPMAGVSSQLILDEMKGKNKWIKEKEELLQWVAENKTDMLITGGAGDIDMLVAPIKEILQKQ